MRVSNKLWHDWVIRKINSLQARNKCALRQRLDSLLQQRTYFALRATQSA